jgi:hypothetical protein
MGHSDMSDISSKKTLKRCFSKDERYQGDNTRISCVITRKGGDYNKI